MILQIFETMDAAPLYDVNDLSPNQFLKYKPPLSSLQKKIVG